MTTLLLAAAMLPPIAPHLDHASLNGALTGVSVRNAAGEVVFEQLGDTRLVPASNQKILSVLYALEVLGPDYRGEIRVWDTEYGPYVHAKGTPGVTFEELRTLGAGGKGGTVRVYQDFAPSIPPTWEWDDLPFAYAGRISAWGVNNQRFEVFAEKGAILPLDPALSQIRIVRGAPVGTFTTRLDLFTRRLYVNGVLPQARTSIGRFAIPDPQLAATEAFRPGAVFVTTHVAPPPREPDRVFRTPPLSELAKFCLEDSDNIYAEQLLLMAAGHKESLAPDAEYGQATARMQEFYVQQVGLTPDDIKPTDGSGMSRRNFVTPNALTKVLHWAKNRPIFPVFERALPKSGEGTLANRLLSVPFAGKTGTLTAVTCLSGYVKRPDGETWTVSLMTNHNIRPASEVRQVHDQIIRSLSNDQ